MSLSKNDFLVKTLGKNTILSPFNLANNIGDGIIDYQSDKQRVLFQNSFIGFEEIDSNLSFEIAGPREKLHFDPSTVKLRNCKLWRIMSWH